MNSSLQPVPISPVEEIVAEMRAGRMVVLVDEEDRENEGDLVLASDHVTYSYLRGDKTAITADELQAFRDAMVPIYDKYIPIWGEETLEAVGYQG